MTKSPALHLQLWFLRSAWVRGPEEPWGEWVSDEDAHLLRSKGSGAAGVAMAAVDGVQLPMWPGAMLLSAGGWERQVKERQEDFHQRQVWGLRCESICCCSFYESHSVCENVEVWWGSTYRELNGFDWKNCSSTLCQQMARRMIFK